MKFIILFFVFFQITEANAQSIRDAYNNQQNAEQIQKQRDTEEAEQLQKNSKIIAQGAFVFIYGADNCMALYRGIVYSCYYSGYSGELSAFSPDVRYTREGSAVTFDKGRHRWEVHLEDNQLITQLLTSGDIQSPVTIKVISDNKNNI